MLAALAWLLAVILVLAIALVLAVVCTPVRLSADVDTARTPALRGKVALFGGLVPIPISTSSRPSKPPEEDTPKRKSGKKKKSKVSIRRMLKAGPRLVAQLLSRIRFEQLSADLVYGFRDPADTGMLFGLLAPVTYGASAVRNSDIHLSPDFDGAVLEGTGSAALRVTPITLVPPLMGFAWSVFVAPKFAGARA